jgi:hypothetical protein
MPKGLTHCPEADEVLLLPQVFQHSPPQSPPAASHSYLLADHTCPTICFRVRRSVVLSGTGKMADAEQRSSEFLLLKVLIFPEIPRLITADIGELAYSVSLPEDLGVMSRGRPGHEQGHS